MNLGNLVETIVQHLLIRGITCFSCRDKFPIVSTIVDKTYGES